MCISDITDIFNIEQTSQVACVVLLTTLIKFLKICPSSSTLKEKQVFTISDLTYPPPSSAFITITLFPSPEGVFCLGA